MRGDVMWLGQRTTHRRESRTHLIMSLVGSDQPILVIPTAGMGFWSSGRMSALTLLLSKPASGVTPTRDNPKLPSLPHRLRPLPKNVKGP